MKKIIYIIIPIFLLLQCSKKIDYSEISNPEIYLSDGIKYIFCINNIKKIMYHSNTIKKLLLDNIASDIIDINKSEKLTLIYYKDNRFAVFGYHTDISNITYDEKISSDNIIIYKKQIDSNIRVYFIQLDNIIVYSNNLLLLTDFHHRLKNNLINDNIKKHIDNIQSDVTFCDLLNDITIQNKFIESGIFIFTDKMQIKKELIESYRWILSCENLNFNIILHYLSKIILNNIHIPESNIIMKKCKGIGDYGKFYIKADVLKSDLFIKYINDNFNKISGNTYNIFNRKINVFQNKNIMEFKYNNIDFRDADKVADNIFFMYLDYALIDTFFEVQYDRTF